MRPLILTSCTNRKRIAPDVALHSACLEGGELNAVAEAWGQCLRSAQPTTRADVLYCGRAFRDAKTAANRVQGSLYVVSAGLGLVPAHVKVPSYSLTVSANSPENVLARINGKCTAARWWNALVSCSPFSDQLAAVIRQSQGAVLIALPAAYISMISAQIEGLSKAELRRLRIFTRAPIHFLPSALQRYMMPYDARFNGVGSPYLGTQGDFAQRALLHFVDRILLKDPRGDHATHGEAVDALLLTRCAPSIPIRQRLSDSEVIGLIHEHWDGARGQSSRMLRFLRDELQVACEQSRFRTLFYAAKEERGEPR
jgi:hypothetical protein